VVLGGGGGAGVARGRRRHGAREGEWGSAAGAVRLGVRRANAWRACGVEGGGSHRQIFSGFKALSRDRLCPLKPPISPWASRSLKYIEQISTAHKMNNKFQVDHLIRRANKCATWLRFCMARCSFGAFVSSSQ